MRMPTPAGTSASHGLRQRNTAHPDRYGTIQVTNTISSTNGSGSEETPPKISAPPQSLRRAHSSDQRATMPPVVRRVGELHGMHDHRDGDERAERESGGEQPPRRPAHAGEGRAPSRAVREPRR